MDDYKIDSLFMIRAINLALLPLLLTSTHILCDIVQELQDFQVVIYGVLFFIFYLLLL